MRAGLLICDHVNPEYRAEFGDYPDMFARWLPELEWSFFDAINGELPAGPHDCEVFFATGSRHSVYEDLPWIDRLQAFLRRLHEARGLFVGVCFGHQLLGQALGGRVEKTERGWSVGVHEFQVCQKKNWMRPAATELNLLMMCQDQVTTLPPGSTVLARTARCPVGIFQVGENMLGIQAHPEFTPAYDATLMRLRSEKMGPAAVEAGLASLQQTVHTDLITDWVMNFLRS